uniref:Glucose-1-phosphate thymidylyltransferase n=1 Tax=Candidatus Aschnera chinzeii TaxID=1485666 RepID=A0AAT9G4U0_9ENTR|nr:MAG: glucose-1-phosphate thymidylyltransferase RfbA [Candidatus Aschnera chinzeii]
MNNKIIKGIVLAAGTGTRLHPITLGVSKQLLPIYNKPMIYYPIAVLMLAGIKEILIISSPKDLKNYKYLLGNGNTFGITFTYAVQRSPNGLAEAFLIADNFIGKDSCCLILGDNIFFGNNFNKKLKIAIQQNIGATIFAYQVHNPKKFAVIEFDNNSKIISIQEKPKSPKSNWVITGLYIYNNKVLDYAKQIIPSSRGELEITAINQLYLQSNKLHVELLGRGLTWLDAGTYDSLFEASAFVKTIEKRQGYKIACLEEIAWQNGWLSDLEIKQLSKKLTKNSYSKYLQNLLYVNKR